MKRKIFFIHGMWARGESLSNLTEYFESKGYDCIAPDLPAHANYEKAENEVADYGFMDFVNHIADEILKLDEKPVVIGHSMGGLITHKIAEMGLAEKVVMITPATQRGITNFNFGSIKGFLSVVMKPFFWRKPIAPSQKGLDYICGEVPEERRKDIFNSFVPESGKTFMQMSLWAFDSSRSTEIENTRIECPVLQIAGGKDKIIPCTVLSKQAKLMEHAIDDFEFKVYDEHGHGIVWEDGWENFADDIINWIEK